MEPLHGFLVTPLGERYNNTVEVDDKKLIINTEITERDYEFVNREAVVVNIPRGYRGPIDIGDLVIVHHNVFRRWFDVRGNERDSGNYIADDLYIVYSDQIFGYNNGTWKGTDGYCFVSPIDHEDDWSLETERPHYGILRYKGTDLEAPVGSTVGFTPDSEYEFTVEDEKVYRILSNQIYGFQETKTKDNCECEDCTCAAGQVDSSEY